MSKKIIWTIVIVIAVLAVAVATVVFIKNGATEKNVEGTLEEIMTKVYAGIPEEDLPMMLENMKINNQNIESYIGTSDVNYKEALARESMIGSAAHSVVLVRLNDANDANDVVAKIKAGANPRKWICVEASNVVVKSKGDLVILIMTDTELTTLNEALAPKLEANFNNL